MVSEATKWSLAAGGYTFGWSVGLLWFLSPLTDTLGQLLSLPPGSASVVLALPVLAVGALGWWAVVERPRALTYVRGAIAGVAIALGTVGCWLVGFAAVWGPGVVLAGWMLPAFVAVVVSVPAVLVVGPSMIFVRTRLVGEPSAPDHTAPLD